MPYKHDLVVSQTIPKTTYKNAQNNTVHKELVYSISGMSARAVGVTDISDTENRAKNVFFKCAERCVVTLTHVRNVLQVQQGADARRDRTTQLVAVQVKDPVRAEMRRYRRTTNHKAYAR